MIKYSKDIMKIKFKTNDDLPLSKIINIPVCVIILSSVIILNVIHRFCYKIVFMNMKKILIF